VDFSALERQDGEWPDYRFSVYERASRPEERPCWIAWSGSELHTIVERHLEESALYGGEISGRGPRYCPSIEDKIVRFPNAERHQIFLEPEGLDTHELYVNGLSTSLPVDVQVVMLQAVTGLSTVRMTRPGYAIEYDYFPPTQLAPWLETRTVEGLFLAGQVNGSTGYEEAAAQGIVAGINAARRGRGEEPVVLGRDDAYVGVLVDDLITKGVDEPYRLFTSRAEYRLLLRQDNALARLGPLASELGLLTDEERRTLDERTDSTEKLAQFVNETWVDRDAANSLLSVAGGALVDSPRLLGDLVKRPELRLRDLLSALGHDGVVDSEVLLSVETEAKYEGYLEREREMARRMSELAHFRLPAELPYLSFASLSTEARQKLDTVRPDSLARAGRIPGISPSDLQNLVVEVLRHGRTAA
jgi:tRNA uridine 5-carboxymethylaminomethyl modification enzyme